MAATRPADVRDPAAIAASAPAVVGPSRARRFWRETRRYPLLPMAVVMIMLVIPAIFAEVIAPHDPLDGDLRVRLLPPAWVEGESEVRDVVAQIVQAAQHVPTWCNAQPWQIIITSSARIRRGHPPTTTTTPIIIIEHPDK